MRNTTKTEGNDKRNSERRPHVAARPADDKIPKSGFERPKLNFLQKKVKRRTEGRFKTHACVSTAYCAGVGYRFLNESAGNATTSLQRESVKN